MPVAKRKASPKRATATTVDQRTSPRKKRPGRLRAEQSSDQNPILELRQKLGLTRKVFSRLSQFSERAIAGWERGERLGAAARQRVNELTRLQRALADVIDPKYIGQWLEAPNDAFDGFKPLEIVERGEVDRIWQMIYLLESGVPS